jgi:hypothetical protein
MNVTRGETEVLKRNPASRRAEWSASLGIPLAVFVLCLVVEFHASPRLTAGAGRTAFLSLLAGLLQVLVMVSIVPWWSAGLLERNSFGTLIAALRAVTMTVSTTVLLLLLVYLEGGGGYAGTLKVQVVVLGVGLLAAGLAGGLRLVLRSTSAAGLLAMLLGYLALASPFWGNALVQAAGESWKPRAVDVVVTLSPMSACSSAVEYDLFRGRMLYTLSVVSDYRYALPAWWAYALVAGMAGLALIVTVTSVSRRLRRR